jgi:DNA-binding transcriptional LysR family regulator
MLYFDIVMSLRYGASTLDRHRARRRLKLRQLEILLAVADTGSMAKAATRLAISQPAVSRAVADMEHTLGVSLLDRSPQGIEPTQYGQALLTRGAAVFNELLQGLQDIEFLANHQAGDLRIGSTAALAEGIVLAVLNRLSRRYPRVVFHVATDNAASTLYDQLRERSIELGFVRMSGLVHEDDIDAEMLFEEPLVVVAGAENPWVRRRKIELSELVNEPWTWPPPKSTFDLLVNEAFGVSGVKPPRPSVYTYAINMRTNLAATGPFLAVIPASNMQLPSKHPLIKMLPVGLPTTRRQVGMITLKNRTLSPLAQRFIECARDLAKPFAKGL